MPCLSNRLGSFTLASGLLVSSKKLSILAAGVKANSIRAGCSPRYAQTCATFLGAKTESPGFSRNFVSPTSISTRQIVNLQFEIRKKSRSRFLLISFKEPQNYPKDFFSADRGVYHRLINRTIRPLNIEIFLNEISALSVDCIHQLLCFLF